MDNHRVKYELPKMVAVNMIGICPGITPGRTHTESAHLDRITWSISRQDIQQTGGVFSCFVVFPSLLNFH